MLSYSPYLPEASYILCTFIKSFCSCLTFWLLLSSLFGSMSPNNAEGGIWDRVKHVITQCTFKLSFLLKVNKHQGDFYAVPLLQAFLWQVPCIPRPVWAWGTASLLPYPSPPSPSLQFWAKPGAASR